MSIRNRCLIWLSVIVSRLHEARANAVRKPLASLVNPEVDPNEANSSSAISTLSPRGTNFVMDLRGS